MKKSADSVAEKLVTSISSPLVEFNGKEAIFPNTTNETIDVSSLSGVIENTSTTSISFSVWINREQSNNTYNMFMGQGLLYFSFMSNNKILWSINAGGQTSLDSVETFSNNEWIHCVFIINSLSMLMYINGTLNASKNISSPMIIGNGFSFGDGRSSSWYPFQGSLKNFKLFDRPLTPEEVAQEYRSGKASINKNTAFAKEFIEV